jgi:AraC-like DNA-binding protein
MMNANTLPVIPLDTCSDILWRAPDGFIGYEPLTSRETLTGMHFDDRYTLELVCRGIQEIHLDGTWRPVPPLHLVWTSPAVAHAHRVSSELETIFTLFPPEMVERVRKELSSAGPLQVPPAAIFPCPPQLQRAFSHLLQEVRRSEQTPAYIISLLLHLILAEFLHLAVQPTLPVPSLALPQPLQGQMSDEMRQAIRLFAEEQSCSSLSLEGIAQTIGLSLFHFSRRFKQEVGMTPGYYLRKLRLNHALPLLFHTMLSLEEISYRSGFGSARQLTEACKAVFGQTPSALRQARGFFFSSPLSPEVRALPSPDHTPCV